MTFDLPHGLITGDLTLSPSPGEQFDLTVQLADQILNFITGTVYLQLEYQLGVSPGVLLQLNGIQFAYTERYLSICVFVSVA